MPWFQARRQAEEDIAGAREKAKQAINGIQHEVRKEAKAGEKTNKFLKGTREKAAGEKATQESKAAAELTARPPVTQV